jgi:hypothetical protein
MGGHTPWISLKIVEPMAGRHPHSPALVISIPKRVVRLATRRNRIKRLVREAVRQKGLAGVSGKIYRFQIRGAVPARLDLKVVASEIANLL